MTEKKKSIKQLIENETRFLDFDLRYQIDEDIPIKLSNTEAKTIRLIFIS